jgi:hypothetical protein
MKFRSLPGSLNDRIAALTPKYLGKLKTKIHIITEDCTISTKADSRITYANLKCKFTNDTKSHALLLTSSKLFIASAMSMLETEGENIKYIYDSAKECGWTQSDIYYDSMVNGVIINDIYENTYNGKNCPEIEYVATNVIIVVCNYYNEQYMGWYFYNENVDEPLNYSNYKF